jgi:hypothetical protein
MGTGTLWANLEEVVRPEKARTSTGSDSVDV